jgi:hypothetical protein
MPTHSFAALRALRAPGLRISGPAALAAGIRVLRHASRTRLDA